jgi:hypothetical protein
MGIIKYGFIWHMIYEQSVVPSIWEDNTIIINTTSLWAPSICDNNIGIIYPINPRLMTAIIKPRKNSMHNLIVQFDHVQGGKKKTS